MNVKVDIKQLLVDLDDLDFATLDGAELEALIYEMLEHLGDPDSQLREGLIYPTLARIISENILSREQYIHLLETCIGERNLFYKLGERGDSVFMRSFSALLVASLISADVNSHFLSKEAFADTMSKCIEYIEAEMDTRGHIDGKGWAHAIAHGADMLLSIVKHPHFGPEKFLVILETIETCLFKEAAYVDAEDKRFIFVLRAMQDRGFEEQILAKWIEKIFAKLKAQFKNEGFSYKYHRVMTNVENFMKSLYFNLKADRNGLYLRVLLFDNIKALPYNRAVF
ncbi:MAG: DUF2785 domain-containing protein [Clostridiales bacterium]|jgi:hypothetical protein|nr:DUF2785 domain-containing protein [Clostridiales bacterium]